MDELQAKHREDSRRTAEQQLHEEVAARQGLEEQHSALERECKRLRGLLESAVARAATQQQDDQMFVDRRLVTKLLVNYMSSATTQKREILQVMARILQFDEDAQRQVGLTSTGWSGYLPFGLGSAHSSGLRTADANDGQNIADEWAEFLLAEARGGGPG